MKSTLFAIPLLSLSAMVAVPAFAVPVFQVTPSVLGGPVAPFNANKIDGSASALLTLDAATQTVAGSGFVQFTSFALDNNAVFPFVSGLNANYELWTTFNYTTKLTTGTFGAIGSLYDVTSLNFTVYGRTVGGAFNSYVPAGVNPTVTPTVNNGFGTIYTIGSGVLSASGPDSASFNAAGGTTFNANADFTLTAFGKTFFTLPDPFYTNAFNSFTNTSQGFASSANGQFIALTQATGSVDFAGVPEPASLALVGIALLGAGAVARRRQS